MGLLESIDRLDREAFLAVAGHGGPEADAVFTLISSGWTALLVWLALTLALRRSGTLVSWIWLAVTLVAAFGAADLVASALKTALERPRPCWALEGQFRLVGACKGAFGLVSGHAATTWALFTVFLRSRPGRWLAALALIWALAVSYSRVYLGVHYPGDVLAGAVVGSSLAALILRIRPLTSIQ
jgi:undecaprenyl-diphosphatase